jgi:hypothetical protein
MNDKPLPQAEVFLPSSGIPATLFSIQSDVLVPKAAHEFTNQSVRTTTQITTE